MWPPCSPMGAQLLAFAPHQPSGVNLWKAYEPPAGCYKKPHLETRLEDHQDRWKSSGHAPGSSTNSGMKGSHGEWHS